MPATQPSKELRVFCHERHVEMRLNQRILNSKGDAKHSLAYALYGGRLSRPLQHPWWILHAAPKRKHK
jgi:hypothetical protein